MKPYFRTCRSMRAYAGRLNGAEGTRTLDLGIANATLSQLSYRPGNVPRNRKTILEEWGILGTGRSPVQVSVLWERDTVRRSYPPRIGETDPHWPAYTNSWSGLRCRVARSRCLSGSGKLSGSAGKPMAMAVNAWWSAGMA